MITCLCRKTGSSAWPGLGHVITPLARAQDRRVRWSHRDGGQSRSKKSLSSPEPTCSHGYKRREDLVNWGCKWGIHSYPPGPSHFGGNCFQGCFPPKNRGHPRRQWKPRGPHGPSPLHTPPAHPIRAQKPESFEDACSFGLQKAQRKSVLIHPRGKVSSVFIPLPWVCFLRQALCQT